MQACNNYSFPEMQSVQNVFPSDASFQDIYHYLLPNWTDAINPHALASMIASYYCGRGAMPATLGLSAHAYQQLISHFFPHCVLPSLLPSEAAIDQSRAPECDDLRQLFYQHRVNDGLLSEWFTEILVNGCMGGNHLWEDLGLQARPDLSRWIAFNFPFQILTII